MISNALLNSDDFGVFRRDVLLHEDFKSEIVIVEQFLRWLQQQTPETAIKFLINELCLNESFVENQC